MKKILLASFAGAVSLTLVGCAEPADEEAPAAEEEAVINPDGDTDGPIPDNEAVINPDGDTDGPIPGN